VHVQPLTFPAAGADELADLGVRPIVTRTLMSDAVARARLVEAALGAAGALL